MHRRHNGSLALGALGGAIGLTILPRLVARIVEATVEAFINLQWFRMRLKVFEFRQIGPAASHPDNALSRTVTYQS